MKLFKHQLGIFAYGAYKALTHKGPVFNPDRTDYYQGVPGKVAGHFIGTGTKKQILTPAQQAYTPRTQAQRDTSTTRRATRMANRQAPRQSRVAQPQKMAGGGNRRSLARALRNRKGRGGMGGIGGVGAGGGVGGM